MKITKIDKNQQGIALLPILVVVLVAVVVVAAWNVKSRQDKKTLNSETSEAAKTSLPESLSTVLEPKELLAVVQKSQADAQISGVELVQQTNGLVYKITLVDGKVLTLNAVTGEKIGEIVQPAATTTPKSAADLATVISPESARVAAVASQPNKKVAKIELELEDGELVYSVRFTDGSRVDINAKTAAVVTTKTADQESKTEVENESENESEEEKTETKPTSSNSGSGSNNSGSSKKSENESEEHSSTTPSSSTTTTSTSISSDQAKAIAIAKLPGKTFSKIESETEDGVAVYSVRFTDGSRVDVRASDGAIVKTVSK